MPYVWSFVYAIVHDNESISMRAEDGPPETHEPSDYLNTLLRDPTSSHLLETLVTRSPDLAFGVLWTYYFQGKLTRLSIHPVANFVVAKSFERLDEQQLREVCLELSGSWARIIRKSMPYLQSSSATLPFIRGITTWSLVVPHRSRSVLERFRNRSRRGTDDCLLVVQR